MTHPPSIPHVQNATKVDKDSPAPWRPNSARVEESHPGRIAKPGDDPSLDLTFKPRIKSSFKGFGGQGERTNFFEARAEYFKKDLKLKDQIESLAKEGALGSRQEEVNDGRAKKKKPQAM